MKRTEILARHGVQCAGGKKDVIKNDTGLFVHQPLSMEKRASVVPSGKKGFLTLADVSDPVPVYYCQTDTVFAATRFIYIFQAMFFPV